MSNVQLIKDSLNEMIPNNDLIVETEDNGSTVIIGPYPSVMFLVDRPGLPDGYMVSVNADAANCTFFISEILKKIPDLVHYGPYAEDLDTNSIIGDPVEAYKLKEKFILDMAVKILAARKAAAIENGPELIVPEQKIVLAK